MWFLSSYAFPCRYVIKDQRGDLNCLACEGSVGYCSPEFCYRLNMRRRRRRRSAAVGIDPVLIRLSRRRRAG